MADKYQVNWSDVALNDLKSIAKFIAIDSISRAANIVKLLRSKASILKNMPSQGRIVPELQYYKIEIYREIVENPWRIIYKIEEEAVQVMAVIDGRRNVEDVIIGRFL